MRIATWNVNGLRARHDYFVAWLRERQPDVVGLQELKMTDDKFPHQALAELGYHAVTHGQKAWNGVAVVSRKKATVTQTGLPGQEEFGARLITAEIGELSFTTVYCPNGKHVGHEDYPRKLAWFDALLEHLRDKHDAARPTVLCGDLNICPAPIDSWNEEMLRGTIFHTDEERECFNRLQDWGLRDLFRQTHPETKAFSWWDYRGGSFHRNQGLRIDFLLGTARVMESVKSIEIDRDYRKKKEGLTPSDHAPVMAEI
jgi:exodeoxyribonuclease-3